MGADALVVTSPTGVDVELAIAGPGSRAYAFVIDWHIRLLAAVTWFAASSMIVARVHPVSAANGGAAALIILPATLIYFLYHPIVELVMRGRTPGKRMAGVRVVDRLGGTPTTLAILIRNAFRLIDCLPVLYGVGLCTTFFSAQRLRFGDMAAGTLLVHDGDTETKAMSPLSTLTLNPSSVDAATLALGTDLLLRWTELEPGTRQHLARELLARLGATVDATPIEPNDVVADARLQLKLREALSGKVR